MAGAMMVSHDSRLI